MSEFSGPTPARTSPFAGHAAQERPSRAGRIGVRLHAAPLAEVTQVSTWIDGIAALGEALGQALGTAVPATTGATARTADGLLVLRTGPEEFLLVAESARGTLRRLRAAIAADIGSVTDLSHARCRIRIEGTQGLDTLSKLYAIDLREPAFPVGEARLTGHHHVGCVLHRLGAEQFDLLVFTTYAHDQLATLIDAALEYGVAVQPAWTATGTASS